jgi:hypothetical protein
VVANRNSPQKHFWRAKIVLLTADGHGTAEIMRATGKAKAVIWRRQERFGEEGMAGLWRDKTRRSRKPESRERMCLAPQIVCYPEWVNADLGPPCCFVATPMHFTVMPTA